MSAENPTRRKKWWLFFGGSFLSVSVAIHVLIGVAATVWVVQTIQAKRKLTFQGAPPSPNPSTRALEHKVQMAKKQKTMSAPQQARRITASAPSRIALPEMPAMPANEATPAKMGGMGGTGMGLGFGGAVGGAGLGGGSVPFFGLRQTTASALAGTFYDLKQDRNGRPTEMAIVDDDWKSKAEDPANSAYFEALARFCRGGWSESQLNKYFKGPAQLFLTQLFIPSIPADQGPEAFSLAGTVKPRRWVIHYQGKVIAPESGRFRFAGFGDDVLAVKFNRRVVLESGFLYPATAKPPRQWYASDGLEPAPDINYHGLGVGDTFEVTAGNSYTMEILIGECPGGFFRAWLLIEKMGATPDRDSKDNPILPIFKLAASAPPTPHGESPVTAPDTAWSIWKADNTPKDKTLFGQAH